MHVMWKIILKEIYSSAKMGQFYIRKDAWNGKLKIRIDVEVKGGKFVNFF